MRGVGSVLLALTLPAAFLAAGCRARPSAPPVGAGLDPKVTAAELAALEGT
jgi:hypothetical protein